MQISKGKGFNSPLMLPFPSLSLMTSQLSHCDFLFEISVINKDTATPGYFLLNGWALKEHLPRATPAEAEESPKGEPRDTVSANMQMFQKIRQGSHSQTHVISPSCSFGAGQAEVIFSFVTLADTFLLSMTRSLAFMTIAPWISLRNHSPPLKTM